MVCSDTMDFRQTSEWFAIVVQFENTNVFPYAPETLHLANSVFQTRISAIQKIKRSKEACGAFLVAWDKSCSLIHLKLSFRNSVFSNFDLSA